SPRRHSSPRPAGLGLTSRQPPILNTRAGPSVRRPKGKGKENDMLRHPKVAAFLRWLPFIIIAVNLFLVFAGVVNLAQAALLVIFLEVCLFGVVLAEFTAMRIAFRKARSQGATRMQALMSGLDTCLPPVVALVIK